MSWYYDLASDPSSTVDKGVRIAIVDVTDPAAIRYRFYSRAGLGVAYEPASSLGVYWVLVLAP